MPCRSDYLEPTKYEKLVNETAKRLLWFIGQADIHYKGTQIRIKKVSKDMYPSKEDGDFVVALLCKELRSLQNRDNCKFDAIVYGRNKEARELANWWEDHEKADNIKANRKAEKLQKAWEEFLSDLYTGDSEMDGHLDYFVSVLRGRNFDVPKKLKN
jgi:hypothetical protein